MMVRRALTTETHLILHPTTTIMVRHIRSTTYTMVRALLMTTTGFTNRTRRGARNDLKRIAACGRNDDCGEEYRQEEDYAFGVAGWRFVEMRHPLVVIECSAS